jgi:hypothetical protein
VAIVQVSRITHRKGLGQPPQLAGAELGWVVDERRLFIGNGTLEEGAPTLGNTEILTNLSDIFAEQSNYTYKGLAAGYQAITGANNSDVVQSLQDWLDQYASVKDFGATGDGVTDDTEAINRALFQLYCRDVNPQIRRALFFPAGVYRVTDTIKIPSYARLIGEGANSSSIVIDADATADFVARYADSIQQTGANIGENAAIPPTNIEIANMGFQTLSTNTDVFLVEDATFCSFTDVSFCGPFLFNEYIDDIDAIVAAGIVGVSFASKAAANTTSTIENDNFLVNSIVFDRCEFHRLTTGIQNTANIKGVLVTDSRFDTLHRGVVFVNPGTVNPGAQGFRLVGNCFDRVHQEAVFAQVNQRLIVSSHNIFYNVGNGFTSPFTPEVPVIFFAGSDNVSIGDLFQRTDVNAAIQPRVQIGATKSIAVTNGSKIQMGSYTRETGATATLLAEASAAELFTVSSTEFPAFKMEYTITRALSVRTGTLIVVRGTDGEGTNLNSNDSGIENVSTDFSLSVTETGDVITVRYTDDYVGESAAPGTIKYSISYLA